MERSTAFYIWVSILVVVAGLALYAILMSLIYSLEVFEFSIHVIWVTMVSNYVFLVVSSTGLCIVTSLGHVFGMQRYELVAKRGIFLALITIIFGMISIGAHLGHPERAMIFNLLTPNFYSAMWWMGTLYTFYIVFIGIEYWLLARDDLNEKILVDREVLDGLTEDKNPAMRRRAEALTLNQPKGSPNKSDLR